MIYNLEQDILREVVLTLMERFGLERRARERMEEFGASAPWQVYIQLRQARKTGDYHSEPVGNQFEERFPTSWL